MTLREWADNHPATDMKYLRLASPTGDQWTLAHAWRISTEEPAKIGMFLHEGDETEGQCKFVSILYEAWMNTWTVRA